MSTDTVQGGAVDCGGCGVVANTIYAAVMENVVATAVRNAMALVFAQVVTGAVK